MDKFGKTRIKKKGEKGETGSPQQSGNQEEGGNICVSWVLKIELQHQSGNQAEGLKRAAALVVEGAF